MNKIITYCIIAISCLGSLAQDLKVMPSPDANKINREASNGQASVVFETSLKDLTIYDECNDERIDLSNGITIFLIEPTSDEIFKELGYPKRQYILKTPKTRELLLSIEEILPQHVYYYTVTLPNIFPLTISAEYLFSQSAKYGIRFSGGKQFGGYLSYKWGVYKASGNNLDNINTDADLTSAKNLGYIRHSITAGGRFGIFNKSIRNTNNSIFLLVGGGYGEYGRQWENPTQVDGNIYFYSDYMKGFEGELAIQINAANWLTLSGGASVLFDKRNVSVDYMLGIGLNLNFSKLKKKQI